MNPAVLGETALKWATVAAPVQRRKPPAAALATRCLRASAPINVPAQIVPGRRTVLGKQIVHEKVIEHEKETVIGPAKATALVIRIGHAKAIVGQVAMDRVLVPLDLVSRLAAVPISDPEVPAVLDHPDLAPAAKAQDLAHPGAALLEEASAPRAGQPDAIDRGTARVDRRATATAHLVKMIRRCSITSIPSLPGDRISRLGHLSVHTTRPGGTRQAADRFSHRG
jgi:hypothetical protein